MSYLQHIHSDAYSPLNDTYQDHLVNDHGYTRDEVAGWTHAETASAHWYSHPSAKRDAAAAAVLEAKLDLLLEAHGLKPDGSSIIEDELASAEQATMAHAMQPHPVTPGRGAIVFGVDEREVPGGVLLHAGEDYPLLSTCTCGRQITQLRQTEPWQYCGA